MIEPQSGVERHESRSGFLISRAEAVLPAVVGVKGGMSLEDYVYLAGNPEGSGIPKMRKHAFRRLILRNGGNLLGTPGRFSSLGQRRPCEAKKVLAMR